jgi:hypothetical protein
MTDFDSPSFAEETELLAQNRPPIKRVITLSHEYLVHEVADQARAFAERDAAIELYLNQGYKLATTFFVPVAIKARIVDTLTK